VGMTAKDRMRKWRSNPANRDKERSRRRAEGEGFYAYWKLVVARRLEAGVRQDRHLFVFWRNVTTVA